MPPMLSEERGVIVFGVLPSMCAIVLRYGHSDTGDVEGSSESI